MSDPSGSQDLSVDRLPLTQQQRDELNQVMLKKSAAAINNIPKSDPAWDEDLGHYSFASMIILNAIDEARALLQRAKQKDTLVTKSMADITKTLMGDPTLRARIHQAFQNHLFSEIADLKIFQIPQPTGFITRTKSAEEKERQVLHKSFVRPYIGKAVDGFAEYLTANNKLFREGGAMVPYYAKSCSIVQSSGTGKSRLLTELRKKGVLVLYMNLREESDLSGFPSRDLVPARILTEEVDCTEDWYSARCCAFFTAIFQALGQELLRLSSTTTSPITSWNDKMCDMGSEARTKFFKEVQFRYEQILENMKQMKPEKNADADHASMEGVESTTVKSGGLSDDPEQSHQTSCASSSATASHSPSSKKRKTSNEEVKSKNETPKLEGESFVTEAYKKMLTDLPKIFSGKGGKDFRDHPKLVISFDEAHSLRNKSSDGFHPSHILGRVINSYSKSGDASVWVAFASTTSQVADFSPPQVIHNSQRVAIGGHLVFPPYTHLGWDQNADSPYDISAKEVGKFNHIVGFGRPLWKSLLSKDSVAEIVQLAAVKLCNSTSFNPWDTDQSLAVLSQRFGLDICFGHPDAVSYVEKGVASHLRICFSTTQDRLWIFTGYPSEPLLSCVAAILLHSENSTCLERALEVLTKKVNGGMVEIGQSGELVSRLVLLLAKDMYVRSHLSGGTIQDLLYFGYGNESDAELIDCQKVSVVDFLPYLFGKTFWSFPAGEKAKTAFQHAYINFSHWVSMTEFIHPQNSNDLELLSTEEWTLRHWHRTSAVQCCHLQPLVDKMIPIYFDDSTHGPDDLKRVSQIFISDKAGRNSSAPGLGIITRTDDTIRCLSSRPFIAILLDFNVESKLNVTFPEKNPNHGETDRCLRIYASGMNYTIFSSKVKTLLEGLVRPKKEEITQTSLDALVRFGSTLRSRNLKWEKQNNSEVSS